MPTARSKLRLTAAELEELLSTERTMRSGTVSGDGSPHVVPLWFVWHAGAIWINNLRKARRTNDLRAGSRAALCIDTGHDYLELRGAVLYGRPAAVAADDPDLPAVRLAFGRKYFNGIEIPDVRSHEWLKMVPEHVVSWDFRKIASGPEMALRDGDSASA